MGSLEVSTPELARGTLIIGTEVVCEDGSVSGRWQVVTSSSNSVRPPMPKSFQCSRANWSPAAHIVADPAAKADLWEKSGACAVDMETLGIVEVADEAGLPWVAVRAIVDSASDTLPPACLTTLREDGHVATGRLLWMICRSPLLLRHFVRLAGDTALARRHLSQAFERWAKSLVVPVSSRRQDESPMKTLVTGGTGFVGANVVRALLKRGVEVRALVRPRSDTRNLDSLEVELVAGDLRDRGSLEAALEGCDTVYHVAAMYALWARNPREIYDSNVTGTINILEAAGQAGVQKIVYTSSVATIGLPKDGTPGTEEVPLPPEDHGQRLQTFQIPRRAGGTEVCPAWPPRGHCESQLPGGGLGCETDPKRPDDREFPARQDPGIRGYRPQRRRR